MCFGTGKIEKGCALFEEISTLNMKIDAIITSPPIGGGRGIVMPMSVCLCVCPCFRKICVISQPFLNRSL